MDLNGLKVAINKVYSPNPEIIDATYDEDLESWKVVLKQSEDFYYISEFDNDGECLAEIELTKHIVSVIKGLDLERG